MFEQTIALDQPPKSKWTLLASLSGQCLAVGVAVLIPLIYTQSLSPVQGESLLLPPVPPPPPERPVKRQAAQTAHVTPKVFTAPAAIPRHIAVIVEQPLVPISGNEPAVSPGPAMDNNAINLLPQLIEHAVPPPPAPPDPPKRAEQAPTSPLHVSGGVQAAKLIRRVIPIYPQLAKQARISGAVHLVGVIGKDGAIQNLQVVSGHPLLVNAAVEAVRQWLYRPTLLSGEPVEVIAPIEVNFNLN
jgi:periplasmic protein TonB